MNNQTDVVVVGAGPVGLLAAIELSMGGVRVLVLERLAAASLASKALGIGPLGSEASQRRGMTAALAAAEARNFAARKKFTEQIGADGPSKKFGGHFAGLSLIRRDLQNEPERRANLVDQQSVEAMLAARVCALGIEIRRECDVTTAAQQVDGIDVEWASPTGGGHIRASYLVGCDGGRSPMGAIQRCVS